MMQLLFLSLKLVLKQLFFGKYVFGMLNFYIASDFNEINSFLFCVHLNDIIL